MKRKGKQHHGYCPLPNHQGKKNSPSFSANLERGIFQCFGCGAKGNVLEFAVLMEKADPKDGAALHKVATELQKRFCPEVEAPTETKFPAKKAEKPKPGNDLPIVVNQPLDFELKGLDHEHPYLTGRGFTPETVRHFGLGFCSRGFLKDRVAIPLHDYAGKLVGYAGRVVDDSTITDENPRYRFPSTRERDGKLFEFRKTLFLYNGFRIKAPVDDLIAVEGFTSLWWLVQNGLPNVVGTMGSDCSERQAELIVSLVGPNGRVWIVPDGDKAGERFAQSVLGQVSPHRFVRWVKLDEGKQPTDLSTESVIHIDKMHLPLNNSDMFRSQKLSKKTFWVVSTVCFVLLGTAALSAFGNQSRHDESEHHENRNPPSFWDPKSIIQTVPAGGSTNVLVTLTAPQNLSNICLRVTWRLANIVQVTPTNISALTKGQTIQVTLSLRPPATFPAKSVEGMIYAKAQNETHGKCDKDDDEDNPSRFIGPPLPVKVNVVWVSYTNAETGVQMSYPDLGVVSQVEVGTTSSGLTSLDVAFQSPGDTNFVSGFGIILQPNLAHFTLADWFHQNVDPDGALLSTGAFKQVALDNGSSAFLLSGSLPDDFGPVMSAYMLSSSGNTIVSIGQAEDNQLGTLGLDETQINQVMLEVLSNLQTP